ncbi:unnamed protein product [Soboliphyme baturini]|uniref:Protein quiver n=1 Tax=Soboliphyme baturini TaxID=241478 RepID=A0A183IU49_9BILA|nr:unnamed protein product [Soboliphyme baturini]
MLANDGVSVSAENQCYSCMSYIYGANWEYLDYRDIYYTPAYFSDHCANTSQKGEITGKVKCANNCVLIVETLRIVFPQLTYESKADALSAGKCFLSDDDVLDSEAGARGHKGYIRGCYDSIFRHGFNEDYQVIRGLKFRKYCVRLNMSMVMARKEKPPNTEVEVCSCGDPICNGHVDLISHVYRTTLFLSICALMLLQHYVLSAN